MKKIILVVGALLLSLNSYANSSVNKKEDESEIEAEIVLKNGAKYNLKINENIPSQIVRIQYSDLILGELVEKRIIQESLNNLCKKNKQYLNPKTIVCKSPLSEKSSCFGVCSDDVWAPPWNIISDCAGCDQEVKNVNIIDHKKIRGTILVNKKTYSPIIRIGKNIKEANLPAIKKILSNAICRDEYHMDNGAILHCGESYDVKYGLCNSSYQFYSQCVAYCKE